MRAVRVSKHVNIPAEMCRASYSLFSIIASIPYIAVISQ